MNDIITTIDPIKDKRWDKFVEDHPFGWLYHLSGWKQIIEKSFSHIIGHYLVLIDKNNDFIKAGLPIYEVKSWITGNRLVSIPFATFCDPLISNRDEMRNIFEAVLNLSKEIGASHIEINTHESSPLIKDGRLDMMSYHQQHYLLLNAEPEQLKKSFHRSCVRQRIDRALKSNIVLKIGDSESDLQDFYRLYVITRKRFGLPPQPFIFIKNVWEIFSPSKAITLLLAKHNNKAIAGQILFKFKDRVSVEFSVSDESFREMSPSHFLFWEAIKLSYDEGYKIIDFGRTSPNNTGLMDFKRRWGTVMIDMPKFYYPKETRKEDVKKEDSMKYKIMQKICNKAPEFILPTIGRFCYRHMG